MSKQSKPTIKFIKSQRQELELSDESSNLTPPKVLEEKKKGGKHWDLVRRNMFNLSRGALVEQIRHDIEKNEIPTVYAQKVWRLGKILIEEGFGTKLKAQSIQQLQIGACLMEWAGRREAKTTHTDERLLGRAHFELWRVSTLTADPYNLKCAARWYHIALQSLECALDARAWIEYARVLEGQGESLEASTIVQRLLYSFETDSDFSTYLLYAGGALKAQGELDRAGSYFFEAMNSGPPRQFSRTDMLFIVARTLEEGITGGVGKTSDLATEHIEQGYKMCYDYLNEEGAVDEASYDEWVNDAFTWRTVADKCAMHQSFTLAADLYGQGLNRDPLAFTRPKLWVRFAKANFRCGRLAEAKLALKQALTIEPYNSQIREQLRVWEFHGRDDKIREKYEQEANTLALKLMEEAKGRDDGTDKFQSSMRSSGVMEQWIDPTHPEGKSPFTFESRCKNRNIVDLLASIPDGKCYEF
jgi:tetratricopeptide (TPR) repeat protein